MSDTFRRAIESLDTALERAEETIRGLRLGVEASVPMSDGRLEWSIQANPDGGKGRRTLHACDDDGGNVIEFPDMSLERRRKCAAAVPALVEALRQKRLDWGASIQEASDELHDYILEGMDE